MRSARLGIFVLAALVDASVLAGCGNDAHTATPEPVVEAVTEPSPPPARVASLDGTAVIAGRAAQVGDEVERDAWIVTDGGASLALDTVGGARIEIDGAAEVALAPLPDEGVWLRSGRLRVIEPPRGPGDRAPTRVATPSATVELAAAGELAVEVAPSRQSFIAVLAGLGEVTTYDVDARQRLRTTALDAGQAVLVGSAVTEPMLGDTDRGRARELAATTFAAPPTAPQFGPLSERYGGDMLNRLDESLVWLEAEQRRGHDLTAQHRDAVRHGDSATAMRLQRELVAHAQRVYGLRRAVTTRWERAELGRRAGGPSRRDRISILLGF